MAIGRLCYSIGGLKSLTKQAKRMTCDSSSKLSIYSRLYFSPDLSNFGHDLQAKSMRASRVCNSVDKDSTVIHRHFAHSQHSSLFIFKTTAHRNCYLPTTVNLRKAAILARGMRQPISPLSTAFRSVTDTKLIDNAILCT